MPRHRGRGRASHRVRTRTITKTRFRTRFSNARRRVRSRISGLHGMKKHAVLITSGIGEGTAVSMATTTLMGQNKPKWLAPVIAAIAGLLTGKAVGHKWSDGIETAISAASAAYIDDRVQSGQPIIPSLQSNTGVLPQGLQVF